MGNPTTKIFRIDKHTILSPTLIMGGGCVPHEVTHETHDASFVLILYQLLKKDKTIHHIICVIQNAFYVYKWLYLYAGKMNTYRTIIY